MVLKLRVENSGDVEGVWIELPSLTRNLRRSGVGGGTE